MLSFIKKIFSGGDVSYEEQKAKLNAGDTGQLLALARNEKTNPEILYLLSSNHNGEVRRAVAGNKATPVQAAPAMAKDVDQDVRLTLASRLVTLLPSLTSEEHSKLYAFAVQALVTLTQDEVVQVRKELSDALRDYAKAPPDVVARLARDVEREVSEPILRFCVALADDELISIISSHPEPWVLSSIASRAIVSDNVTSAIIDADDAPAIRTLLQNSGCKLNEEQLYEIIERARVFPDWHRPIALRTEMSIDLAQRLAGFVDEAILDVLEKRSDFDATTRKGIADLVKRRLEYSRSGTPTEAAAARVERYAQEKKLTPELIHDALNWQDSEFVILALALRSAVHPQVVRRMLETHKPKPVIALCRKANLPMRLAVDMQRHLAKVTRHEIMYAKDGTDYPMTDAEVTWQLEFFGAPGTLA